MPILQNILTDKNQQSIIELAALYGFENIRIFKETSKKGILILLAYAIEKQKNLQVEMETALSKALDCQVKVLIEQNLKDSCKESIIHQSVPICDICGLEKLFKQPLDTIEVQPAVQDQSFLGKRRLKLADDFLNAKKRKLSDFFDTSPQPCLEENKAPPIISSQEKFLDLFAHKDKDFIKKVLKALPVETLSQIEETSNTISQIPLKTQTFH